VPGERDGRLDSSAGKRPSLAKGGGRGSKRGGKKGKVCFGKGEEVVDESLDEEESWIFRSKNKKSRGMRPPRRWEGEVRQRRRGEGATE